MNILFKNAKIYNELDSTLHNIKIENGIITKISLETENVKIDSDNIIDLNGKTIMPGFVDMHCHLREPGFEYKEDILSGTMSASAGGFTAICCMPNTRPVTDTPEIVKFIKDKADSYGYAKVYPIGAVTMGQKGESLTEAGALKKSGVVALSDDGMPVESALMMNNAMLYAKSHDLFIISHCEDKTLAADGVVNEGVNSTLYGYRGIPRSAEEVMVAREIVLSSTLKTHVHIAHISTAGSVELIRQAKNNGINVTCETCPHYFSATDDLIKYYDSSAKVNPPLRTEKDRQAIIKGLIDGTIDAIATDHAPHHIDDKLVEFSSAANGISGFETAFSLGFTYLVKTGFISLEKLSELMTKKPASILKVPFGEISESKLADLVVVDLNEEYIVDSKKFLSKGKNTPFNGFSLQGKVKITVLNGKIVYNSL